MRLRSLEIQSIGVCDNICIHCCNDPELRTKDILSIEHTKKIIEQVNPESISITGGEATLYMEFLYEIIPFCSQKNIATQLNTHGLNLDQLVIEQLSDMGLSCFHFSFNSLDDIQLNEIITNRKKFQMKLVENIRCAIATRSLVNCETLLTSYTKNRVQAIHHYLAGLGVDIHELQCGLPNGAMPWEYILSPKELADTIESVLANRHKEIVTKLSCVYVSRCSPYNHIYSYESEKNLIFNPCPQGVDRLHIHNDGTILICDQGNLNFKIGNIHEDDIIDIYSNSEDLKHFRDSKPDKCNEVECPDWDKCRNMCQGFVYNRQGKHELAWTFFDQKTKS